MYCTSDLSSEADFLSRHEHERVPTQQFPPHGALYGSRGFPLAPDSHTSIISVRISLKPHPQAARQHRHWNLEKLGIVPARLVTRHNFLWQFFLSGAQSFISDHLSFPLLLPFLHPALPHSPLPLLPSSPCIIPSPLPPILLSSPPPSILPSPLPPPFLSPFLLSRLPPELSEAEGTDLSLTSVLPSRTITPPPPLPPLPLLL